MIEEIDNLEAADRYLHLMVFGPADPAGTDLGAWLTRNRRWSCEHITRTRVHTQDWLAGLSAATGGLMWDNDLGDVPVGARKRLVISANIAPPVSTPRKAFISSNHQSLA